MIVIYSSRTDVYENLAAEDVLLDDDTLREPVVFIYRNRDAVVIGKNQNPWRECAVSRLEGIGVALARRISGGGTVFHDEGNFNISCIVPRAAYRREAMLRLFIAGLKRAGVPASIAATTSLVVQGKKISGSAFCYRRDKVLHHATLLWMANLEKLRVVLTPDIPNMETRAVASCPMPVINLSDMLTGAAPDSVIHAIVDSLSGVWGARTDSTCSPFAQPAFTSRLATMKSWDWQFGATPDFSIVIESKRHNVHAGLSDLPNHVVPFGKQASRL